MTYLAQEVGGEGQEFGPLVAVKVLYQQRDQGPYLRRLATEAHILQGLNHANIVECRGFVHRTGHSPYLVTRFEEGGSLLDHIRRVGTLPIQVAANIGRQVCWALDVAHRQGVIHRDLKPENVLLVRPVARDVTPDIRVADFGIAKIYGGFGERLTRMGAFVGTPQYAAPEQFEGLSPEPATDTYAVGALLYFLLTAQPIADFMAELDPDSQRVHLLRHLPPKLDLPGANPNLVRWMETTLAVAMAVEPGDRCDLITLDRRLADIGAERDPGFIRLPPAPNPEGAPRNATITGEVLPEPTNSTDEVQTTPPDVSPDPGRPKVVTYVPPAVRPPPDPAAGTADPLGADVRTATPSAAKVGALIGAAGAAGAAVAAGVLAAAPGRAAAGERPDTPPSAPSTTPSAINNSLSPPPGIDTPLPNPSVIGDPGADSPLSQPHPGGPPIGPAAPSTRPATPPPLPATAPPPPATTPERRTSGGTTGRTAGGCGLLGLALVGGMILLGGGGYIYWTQRSPAAVVLTGKESDPAVARDWHLVANALGAKGIQAEHACAGAKMRGIALEATVDGGGKLIGLTLLNYDHEPTRACMENVMKATPFPRNGKGTVRVAVTLQE